MDNGKDVSGEKSLPATTSAEALRQKMTEDAANDADQRIQFVPPVTEDRRRPILKEGEVSDYAPCHIRRPSRAQGVVPIPQVISQTDKKRRKREKAEEKKLVDFDEHLMTHEEVVEPKKTKIDMEKPGDSFGVTSEQATQLLKEHGLDILTEPSRRHPFLEYLDSLTSLFNLLLVFVGFLKYILLGINYHDNFQNASAHYHNL
jgi:sodium/potassium-transporting ATPase subunit alpha